MRNIRVARRYASALLLAGEEGGELDAIASDLDRVAEVIAISRDFQLFLKSPVVNPVKKMAVLDALFEGAVGKTTMTFLKLLVQKGREELLADVIEQFHALLDEMQGVVAVEVTSVVALSHDQERRLQQQLEEYTGKQVRVHATIDTAIRGGVVARIGDTVIDGSIAHQLAVLRDHMVESGPSEYET